MAQTLKNPIKASITAAATKQFNKAGYINTNMKDIAEQAGISVGNIYRYFKDKENLFESIVNPVVEEIYQISESLDEKLQWSAGKYTIGDFAGVYLRNKQVFTLVLLNSNNTKFESIKKSIIERFYTTTVQFPTVARKIKRNPDTALFIKAFATAFINGIVSILLEDIEDQVKVEQFKKFRKFMQDSIKKELMGAK
ncbi:MAG: TetR/AcrR family transcriptional regulator [Clostridiales bacterium]|nr:TetR/AcrR family transcriptional regulator [Clostridiales bacterium]